MKKHEGNLVISKDTEVDFEEITGSLRVEEDVKFVAKKLKRVGGYLSIYSNVTLPKLETVGGYLYIYSNVTLDAPKLETVGGNLHINSNVTLPKLVNKNDPRAKAKCQTALALSLKKKGLIKIDGILSWPISKKKVAQLIVFKVRIVGQFKVSFVVQRGDQFSHGKTVKEATESLRHKLSDRDTSRFKKWTLATKVKAEDAIQAYRAITGACEFAVKNFCESINVPEKITIQEVVELTKGKYGSEQFAAFFQ